MTECTPINLLEARDATERGYKLLQLLKLRRDKVTTDPIIQNLIEELLGQVEELKNELSDPVANGDVFHSENYDQCIPCLDVLIGLLAILADEWSESVNSHDRYLIGGMRFWFDSARRDVEQMFTKYPLPPRELAA
jgi:hypothetical protein